MDLKIHDLYLNLTCEYDNILKTKVKYWTAYIDTPIIAPSNTTIKSKNSSILFESPIGECTTCFEETSNIEEKVKKTDGVVLITLSDKVTP